MTVVELDIGIPMSSAWMECYNRCLAEHNSAKEKAAESDTDAHSSNTSNSEDKSPISLLQNHCHETLNNMDKEGAPAPAPIRSRFKGYGPITCEPFSAMDLLKYSSVQFDKLTETYGLSFYMTYLARWPEYFQKLVNPNGHIVGYIMGKSEGHDENWHGHVTCLSILAPYRGQGLAGRLMKHLEDISEAKKTYFVDLFVRKSNEQAIGMYKKLGYVVYRTVLSYYSGSPEQSYKDDEDAYDMRKAMSRDVHRTSIIPLTHPVLPEDLD